MPLSEQQKQEFRIRAKNAGASDDQIERTLTMDAATGSPLEAELSGGGNAEMGLPPPAPLDDDFYKRLTLELMKMGITSAAGGPLIGRLSEIPVIGEAIKRFPSVFQAIGAGGGQYGGELMRQKSMGEPINKTRAALEGAGVAGTDLVLRGAIGLTSSMAGTSKEAVGAALKNTSLLKKRPRSAESALVEHIEDDLARNAGIKRPGRVAFEDMMAGMTSSGGKVDGAWMLYAIDDQIAKLRAPGGGTNARAVMMKLAAHRKRVADMVAKYPNGIMPAENYDEILRGEFTSQVYKDKPGSAEFVDALEGARNEAARYLYDQVGKGARSAQALANYDLGVRDRLVQHLKPQSLGAGGKVVQATDPANVAAGPRLEQAIKDYDAVYGTKHWNAFEELNYNRELRPLSKKGGSEGEVAQLPVFGTRSRNLLERGSAMTSRGLMRLRTLSPGGPSATASWLSKQVFGTPVKTAPNSPPLEEGADAKTPETLYSPESTNIGGGRR